MCLSLSGGPKPRLRVPAALVSGGGWLPGSHTAACFRCVLTGWGGSQAVWGPFPKGTNLTHKGSAVVTSLFPQCSTRQYQPIGDQGFNIGIWGDTDIQAVAPGPTVKIQKVDLKLITDLGGLWKVHGCSKC